MFKEEYGAAANAAAAKAGLLKKNPIGYFVLSMLAGMYIGFGALLTSTIGAQLGGSPFTKLIMGMAFGAALSLVVIAGAELFTGNNMVMFSGIAKKTIKPGDAIVLWCVCWLGNLAGALLLSVLFCGTGLNTGAAAEFIAGIALSKMTAGAGALFFRGVLCNMLVCIAVWCGFKCKSESGKLIMIFWCLLAFFTTGFEHSVANMTTLTVALIGPAAEGLSIGGWIYNLLVVTIGNMVGGICLVGLPYYLASKD
ncbi:MAG: formate/nitrite transporter family protein [Lachnospiraceae bacterium]|nr:formate/nitrite transporter family protein [Lachnospiraceae bacterium]